MSQEIINWEQITESTALAELPEQKVSEQELYVRNVLKDYTFQRKVYKREMVGWEMQIVESTEDVKADPESIIKELFNDANSVITQNNNGDIIPDFKARAQLKIKLLESMGIIKPKQTEVKINFLSLLFWKK